MTQFSIPLAKLAEMMGGDLETVVRKATLDLFATVVRRSPVDTGRFKGNWNASYGTPTFTVGGRVDKTKLGTIGANMKAEVQLVESLPVGGVTYLSNSMPYAARLEHGWSGQAPSGMVKLAAEEFARMVAKAVKAPK
jgi:hypothetical protein